MNQALVCILLVTAATAFDFTKWLNPNNNKMPSFSKSGFFDVSDKVDIEGIKGTVVALGDFNGDK